MHHRVFDCNNQLPAVTCDANAETKRCRYFKEYILSHPSLLAEMSPDVWAFAKACRRWTLGEATEGIEAANALLAEVAPRLLWYINWQILNEKPIVNLLRCEGELCLRGHVLFTRATARTTHEYGAIFIHELNHESELSR